MKINQLSVFVENRPGSLRPVCKALADGGIDLLSLTVADTEEFGIVRILVPDPQAAEKVLKTAGYAVKVTEVVAVEVPQRPGGLLTVLDALDEAKQVIEYMYAFAGMVANGGASSRAVLVFRFANPDTAIAALAKHGISAVVASKLFQHAK